MQFLNLIWIAVGLAMDACAVAVAASIVLQRVSGRQLCRFAFHFGLFQSLMPIIGWFVGQLVASYIHQWDHWVACALLAIIGGKAIFSALKGGDEAAVSVDPTRGASLVMLSVATSIDALAVGLSFAMLGVSIWIPAVTIGIITAAITATGMLIGSRLGARLGKQIEIFGGIVLIAIGIKIVIEHLLAQ